jgi:hypothetical protein
MSVRLHGTTRETSNGFSENLTLASVAECFPHISVSAEAEQQQVTSRGDVDAFPRVSR